MKKMMIVLLLLLAAGAGVYFYVTSVKDQGEMLVSSDFLPDDCALYARITDMEKQYTEFMESPLGKTLLSIDYVGIDRELDDVDLPEDFDQDLDEFKKEFEAGKKLFFTFFGEDLTLALMPLYNTQTFDELDQLDPDQLTERLLANIVGISRLKINADVFELMNSQIGKQQKLPEIKHNEDVIHGYTLDPEFSLYFSIKDGTVLWALHPDTIKRCLDVKADETVMSLTQNATFADLQGRFPADRTAFQYISFEQIIGKLEILFADEIAEMEEAGETLSEMPYYKLIKSLKALGSASYDETELIGKTKSITLFDKTKGDLSLISAFQHQPETSKALELIPESPLLFSWNNYFDLDQMMISITDDERQSVSDGLYEMTGVTLDELVSATGNEIAFFVNQVNFGGLFPVPDFSFYLKIKDKTVLDKLLATGLEMVKAQGGMNVETEDIEGVSYQYFPIPYGSDITPGFTYIDDYFVISMNSKTVKSMLNARETGAHVLKNSGINMVSKAEAANNSVAFMDIIKGCDTLKSIGGWGSNMIGFAGAEAVDEYKVITEKVVYPILDALKMYETLGVRYWTEEDTFMGEFRVKSAEMEKTE